MSENKTLILNWHSRFDQLMQVVTLGIKIDIGGY